MSHSLLILLQDVEMWGCLTPFLKISLYFKLFSKRNFGLTAYLPEDNVKGLLLAQKIFIFEIDHCPLIPVIL